MNELDAATLTAESYARAYHQALELLGCPVDPREFDGDPRNWLAERMRASTPGRGWVWGGRTPFGQRFYGIDFGPLAIGMLRDG